MSMIGNFAAVSASRLDELIKNPEQIGDFLEEISEGAEGDGDFLDVDKSWHGIHFLLTGSAWEGDAPLKWVVLAPTEIGEDVGYGPARILKPPEVAEVSKALVPITVDQLRVRYDCEVMNKSEIYPQGWAHDDADYILGNFEDLKKLYESAARRSMGIIQWLN
mgnify:CR=1 FL=1